MNSFPALNAQFRSETIGSLATVKAGGTPSTSVAAFWGGKIPWMASGEVHLRRISSVKGRITELGLRKSSTQMFPVGTVLVALAGQGKTRGTVAITEIELCTNQSLAGIVCDSDLLPDYLFYDLSARYDELRGESAGDGGRGGLNLSILKKLAISYPPEDLQLEIISILDSVDSLLDLLAQGRDKATNLRLSAIQEIFAGNANSISDDSKAWKSYSFDDVLQTVNSGSARLDSRDIKAVGWLPVVDQGQAFIAGYCDLESYPIESVGGNIVFGDHTCITKYIDFPFAVGADGTKVLASRDPSKFNTKFLAYVLEFDPVLPTGYNRHFSFLKERHFKIPSFEEQSEIVWRLEAFEINLTWAEQEIVHYESIKRALMNQLLKRGE